MTENESTIGKNNVRHRKAHRKSRAGCRACKSRRAKCDEQGPPCVNCVIRKTECIYDQPKSTPTVDVPALSPTNSETSLTEASYGNGERYAHTRNPLELELMVHWATSTHKTLGDVSMKDDWLYQVSPLSLVYDYLMDAILAISAIHIADSAEPHRRRKYIKIGLEYYGRCCESFRHALATITLENYMALIYCSIILTLVRLYAPQYEDGDELYLNRILSVFELLQGTWSIAHELHDPIKDGPLNAMSLANGYESRELDDSTALAIHRLSKINEDFHGLKDDPKSYNHCREAINSLRMWWTKAHLKDHSIAMIWLLAASREFVALIAKGHRIAKLILLHWSILLEQVRAEERWWGRSVGVKLVDELSRSLDTGDEDANCRDALLWVRERVRLVTDPVIKMSNT